MTFTHNPLTDDAADAERRALLRSPDCRELRLGALRQQAIAQTVMGIGVVTGLALGFNGAPRLAAVAAVLTIAAVIWFLIVAFHDASAERAQDEVAAAFAVPPDRELKYLLEMKEKYHEIDAAIRTWKTKGLTIRSRDVRAVRAWVHKVEPVRQRQRLLRQLDS